MELNNSFGPNSGCPTYEFLLNFWYAQTYSAMATKDSKGTQYNIRDTEGGADFADVEDRDYFRRGHSASLIMNVSQHNSISLILIEFC